ncbi:hypothetical protein [Microcoleus sp. Pol17_C1]|uniref:hypothetical protein n=1 Tax=unclassified Microcoleus TaxID=2642155 RepID=UPI002FD1F26E
MTEPIASYRRIDHLKAHAYSLGLTNDEAKKFGKLSKTSTWKAVCEAYCVDCPGRKNEHLDSCQCIERILCPVDSESRDTSGWINNGLSPVCRFTPQNSISFLDWVDLAQLVAFVLASAGVFVLAMSMWRQINPLNLFPPIRVNIQIGAK